MHLTVQRVDEMENSLSLSVEGMHCGACVRRVTNALEAVEGVKVSSVEVGSAIVAFDSAKASAEEIAAAVARTGFVAHIQG
jgi:copper chaperone